jgi:hypothetical protein
VSPGGVRARQGRGRGTYPAAPTALPPTHSFLFHFLPLSSLHCLLIIHTISTDQHSDDPYCGSAQAQAIKHQQNCLAASHLRHGSRAPGRVGYSIVFP